MTATTKGASTEASIGTGHQGAARKVGHFLWYLLQMVLAMMAGMAVYKVLFGVLLAPAVLVAYPLLNQGDSRGGKRQLWPPPLVGEVAPRDYNEAYQRDEPHQPQDALERLPRAPPKTTTTSCPLRLRSSTSRS